MPPPKQKIERVGDTGALVERHGDRLLVSFASNQRAVHLGSGIGLVAALFYASTIVGQLIWVIAPVAAYFVLARGSGARVGIDFDARSLRVAKHGVITRELVNAVTSNIREFEADDDVVLLHEKDGTRALPLPIRTRGHARTVARLLERHREELMNPPVRDGGYR